jgi:non-ribosomal peptide synthetase component F
MDMTSAKIYWRQKLFDYNVTKPMNLPFDRKCFPDSIQTGQGLSIEINFKRHITEKLVEYASTFNVTLYHVCLTIYYIFLFKLTGGQRDLIVGTVHVNRYRPELQNIIGMFVNSLPMRVRINPQDTFEQLLSKVSTMIFEAHMYSSLPYQSIIEQIPMGQTNERNLIQTMFTLDELSIAPVQLDDTTLIEPLSKSCLNDNTVSIGTPENTVTMFDMTLVLEHTIEIHSLRAELIASTDLFDSDTIVNIAKRFQLIIELLVSSLSAATKKTTSQSICDLSLILPDEIVQDMHYKHFHLIPEINLTGITLLLNLRQYLFLL